MAHAPDTTTAARRVAYLGGRSATPPDSQTPANPADLPRGDPAGGWVPEPWPTEELSADDVVTRLRLRALATDRPGEMPVRDSWVARHQLGGRPALVVLCVLVFVALGAGAWVYLRAQPAQSAGVQVPATTPGLQETTAASGDPGVAASGVASAAASRSAVPTITVHVVGQVAKPGLVTLPAGARVAEAVEAVGGATEQADIQAVNLARPLQDGEQVIIPAPGQTVAAAQPVLVSGDSAAPPESVVNINTATAEQLDELPGIGPVLAGRIEEYRGDNGPFTAVEDLGEVSGIGPALLDKLDGLVTV